MSKIVLPDLQHWMGKRILDLFVFAGIHWIAKNANKRKLTVLMYHGFTAKTESGKLFNHHGKLISIPSLRRQLAYIAKYYTPLSLEGAFKHILEGTSWPDNSLVITVDDGYESVYRLARPVFKEFNIPFTTFLVTDFIGKQYPLWPDRLEYALLKAHAGTYTLKHSSLPEKITLTTPQTRVQVDNGLRSSLKCMEASACLRALQAIEKVLGASLLNCKKLPEEYRPMTWSQIRAMKKDPLFSFGGHTCTHPLLTRCSLQQMKSEISKCRRILCAHIGSDEYFAYPNGDFNSEIVDFVTKVGYKGAVSTLIGLNVAPASPFLLKRLNVINGGNLAEFALLLSGVGHVLYSIRKRLY